MEWGYRTSEELMWSGVSCGACYSVPPELPLSLFSTCWWGRAAVCKIGNEGAQRT